MRFVLNEFLGSIAVAVLFSVINATILFLFRILLKKQIIAIIGYILFWSFLFNDGTAWTFATHVAVNAGFVFLMMRFGLIAFAAGFWIWQFFNAFPLTLDSSAWYKDYGYAILALLAVIVVIAFRKSLAGRPILAARHLDD
jgi:hypothetical protein